MGIFQLIVENIVILECIVIFIKVIVYLKFEGRGLYV